MSASPNLSLLPLLHSPSSVHVQTTFLSVIISLLQDKANKRCMLVAVDRRKKLLRNLSLFVTMASSETPHVSEFISPDPLHPGHPQRGAQHFYSATFSSSSCLCQVIHMFGRMEPWRFQGPELAPTCSCWFWPLRGVGVVLIAFHDITKSWFPQLVVLMHSGKWSECRSQEWSSLIFLTVFWPLAHYCLFGTFGHVRFEYYLIYSHVIMEL